MHTAEPSVFESLFEQCQIMGPLGHEISMRVDFSAGTTMSRPRFQHVAVFNVSYTPLLKTLTQPTLQGIMHSTKAT